MSDKESIAKKSYKDTIKKLAQAKWQQEKTKDENIAKTFVGEINSLNGKLAFLKKTILSEGFDQQYIDQITKEANDEMGVK